MRSTRRRHGHAREALSAVIPDERRMPNVFREGKKFMGRVSASAGTFRLPGFGLNPARVHSV